MGARLLESPHPAHMSLARGISAAELLGCALGSWDESSFFKFSLLAQKCPALFPGLAMLSPAVGWTF